MPLVLPWMVPCLTCGAKVNEDCRKPARIGQPYEYADEYHPYRHEVARATEACIANPTMRRLYR